MRLTALAAVAMLLTSPAWAIPPPYVSPNCAAPEFDQMDFWVGNWRLTWDGGEATSQVTKEFDGCVVHEAFRQEEHGKMPLIGASFSAYHAINRIWRQTWIDNRNGYYHLSGGPQPGGTFMLQAIRMGREPQMLRMVFEDIKADSFTWRLQVSDDGDAWTDKWVIHYARTK